MEIPSPDEGAIPLGISKVDPSFVERALLANGKLPERGMFKIADWVKVGVLEFGPLVVMTEIEAYAQSGPCPWDSAKSLWMVSFRSVNGHMISPVAKLVYDPELVVRAHLVAGGGNWEARPLKSGEFISSQIFLYELEIKEGEGQLGGPAITTNQGELDTYQFTALKQIREIQQQVLGLQLFLVVLPDGPRLILGKSS